MGRLLDILAVLDLDAEPGRVHVNCPYAERGAVKSLDTDDRRWDDKRHVWVVELPALTELVRALLGRGLEVDIWHDDEVRTLKSTAARRSA